MTAGMRANRPAPLPKPSNNTRFENGATSHTAACFRKPAEAKFRNPDRAIFINPE
jgi:hypothetical protein